MRLRVQCIVASAFRFRLELESLLLQQFDSSGAGTTMSMGVMQMLPIKDMSDEEITPDFVLLLISRAPDDVESRGLMMHLMRQSLEGPLARVKEYVGDPSRLDAGTMGEPYIQPGYVEVVNELLSYSLYSAAQVSIIGAPRCFRLSLGSARFNPCSWWIRDAPALPLSSFLLWSRSMAWYIYWFVEHPRES